MAKKDEGLPPVFSTDDKQLEQGMTVYQLDGTRSWEAPWKYQTGRVLAVEKGVTRRWVRIRWDKYGLETTWSPNKDISRGGALFATERAARAEVKAQNQKKLKNLESDVAKAKKAVAEFRKACRAA